jgi:tRNA (cytidine/uridine-2'-O-)-methyltransferase
MREGLRSLNLSNTVAVAVYEILRQGNFEDLKTAGELTRFSWDGQA